jgi:hypothetical protein
MADKPEEMSGEPSVERGDTQLLGESKPILKSAIGSVCNNPS